MSIYDSDITSSGVTIQRAAYDKPSAGSSVSEMIQFSVFNTSDAVNVIYEGQQILFSFRLHSMSDDTQYTDWVDRGRYFIQSIDRGDSATNVSAYDEVSLLDGYVPPMAQDMTVLQYANVLESYYGCVLLKNSPMLNSTISTVNASNGNEVTMLVKNFVLPLDKMDGVTARDIVSSIAGMLGGNAYIDSSGLLQCKSPFYNVSKSSVDVSFSASHLEKGVDYVTFQQVVIEQSSGSGGSGNNNYISYPGAQCTIKLNSLFVPEFKWGHYFASYMKKYVLMSANTTINDRYYNATGAYVTPLVELFDVVQDTASSEKFTMTDYSLTIAGNCTGQLSRPSPNDAVSRIAGKIYWSPGTGYIDTIFWASKYTTSSASIRPITKYTCLLNLSILHGTTTAHVFGNQRLTFTASYYYKNGGGAAVHNVDITVRIADRYYDMPYSSAYMVYAVIENYDEIDIDPSRPYSIGSITVKSSYSSASSSYQVFDYDYLTTD